MGPAILPNLEKSGGTQTNTSPCDMRGIMVAGLFLYRGEGIWKVRD
jgi:hypothetical protein